ncbi:MAG: hypothetical protein Fur009_0780 [Candidatus Microgenomates bacterium]
MLAKKILVLEDNLKVVAKIIELLDKLESEKDYIFEVVVLSSSKLAKDFLLKNKNNNFSKINFDVVILDRDCNLYGSFHELLDKKLFDNNRVISISTVDEYNNQARKKGVKKIVKKDLKDLDKFAEKLTKEIEKILTPSWLKRFSLPFKT